MVGLDFTPPSRVRQHLRDVQLIVREAHACGQELSLTNAHLKLLETSVSAGDGELDNSAIVLQIRRMRWPIRESQARTDNPDISSG